MAEKMYPRARLYYVDIGARSRDTPPLLDETNKYWGADVLYGKRVQELNLVDPDLESIADRLKSLGVRTLEPRSSKFDVGEYRMVIRLLNKA